MGWGKESRGPGRSTFSGLRKSWGSQDGQRGLGEQRCARSWAQLPIHQLLHRGLVPVGCRVLGARVSDTPSPCLTVFRLVQDVEDVCQLQRQLIRLLGHVRVHALDLGAV